MSLFLVLSLNKMHQLSQLTQYCYHFLSVQGIYLVALGWNEGSVGVALSMMGFTALLVQTYAGDVIDKTTFDRRAFLSLASVATAFSASAILFVHEGNKDHMLIFGTKIIEGISSSFIGPCLAALTLASFGPNQFDEVMASNILWGHVGSVASAVLAGIAGYVLYPDIKYCFLVIGFSALMAVCGVRFLPEGDPLLGRGLNHHAPATDDRDGTSMKNEYINMENQQSASREEDETLEVSTYWSVFADRRTMVLCLTGFFFHFAVSKLVELIELFFSRCTPPNLSVTQILLERMPTCFLSWEN